MISNRLKEQGYKIKYDSEIEKFTIKVHKKLRAKKASIPNSLSKATTAEKDLAERESVIEDAVSVYRKMLPEILVKLSKIKDPRNPSYVKHQMTVLFAYGILCFVFHIGSRRQANKEISRGVFAENIKEMFPELETLPHADTLARLLEGLEDVSQIQECATQLLKDLIRQNKMQNHLIKNRYLIAIDGTQKQIRDYKYAEKALHKKYKDCEKYYVYVVEAVLVLKNGLTLPFLSEILENDSESSSDEIEINTKIETLGDNNTKEESEEKIKQDSENKGFKRLAKIIKKVFPKLPITLVMDGLYANGPIMEICKKNEWQYMITLKDKSLKEVWREVNGLIRLNPQNRYDALWGERNQTYTWANYVEYEYKDPKTKRYKTLTVYVVICNETWEERHPRSKKKIEKKETRYAWISSELINADNVFFSCTQIARYRWRVENFILKEKHQGYNYEHFYSYNWNAMKGYHYLMHIAHMFNALAIGSDLLAPKVAELGIRGFVKFFKLCCNGSKWCCEKIKIYREKKYIYRLSELQI